MTDYNDGNWHGWNGGECPVHPKSIIQAVRGTDGDADVVTWEAGNFQASNWIDDGRSYSVIAFRVVKEYREPREFWLYRDSAAERFGVSLGKPTAFWGEVIHVREVIE